MDTLKCGYKPDNTDYRDEICCIALGCINCKHHNGVEYYISNTKKALAMWARHQLKEVNNHGKH